MSSLYGEDTPGPEQQRRVKDLHQAFHRLNGYVEASGMLGELELLTTDRVVDALTAKPATSLENRIALFSAILDDGAPRKRVAAHLRAVADGSTAFDPDVVEETEEPRAKRCRGSR